MNFTHCIAATLGLGLVTTLEAQAPGAPSDLPTSVASNTGVVDADGQLTGVGPGYKMLFDARGASFVPALGRRAPHNYPLRFELVSIRKGETMVQARPDAIEPVVSENRASYELSPTIRERFDTRPEGVELSLEFLQRPEGSGDLIVTYRVVTELGLDPEPLANGGRRFQVEGLGGVSVGSVTGIAADGSTVPGDLRIDDETMELVLPAGFVDTAAYPLVLDPLIGGEITIEGSTSNDSWVDVCYDAGTDDYLYVFQTVFSATNVDVRAQRALSNGTPTGSPIVINGSGVAMRPSVGNVNNVNRWLVAWQDSTSIFGPWDVQCRHVTGNTAALSPSIVTIASGSGDQMEPDVGNSSSSDNDALVVWSDRTGGIRGQEVDVGGASPVLVGSPKSISSVSSDQTPAISSNQSGARRCVVWVHVSGLDEIQARAVSSTLTPSGSVFSVSGTLSSSLEPKNADVDGDGLRFTVVWDVRESGAVFERDVYCRALRFSTFSSTFSGDPAAPLTGGASDPGDDERDPAIALIGSSSQGTKQVVAYTERDAGLATTIRIVPIGPDSCDRCGAVSSTGSGSGEEVDQSPAIASRYQVGQPGDDCIVAFIAQDEQPPFLGDVYAQRVEAFSTDTVSDLGGGCGAGGTASTAGEFVLGATNPEVRLTGAPGFLGTVLALDVFPPIMGTIPCGPCNALVGLTIESPAASNPGAGTAAFPLAVPCNIALLGNSLTAQWYVVNLGASPCPIVSGISVSNTIRIEIGD